MTVADIEAPRGGNLYNKYTSRNPVARALFQRFMTSLRSLLPAGLDARHRIVEVGCGEGHLLNLIHQHYGQQVPCEGCDHDPAIIQYAQSLYPQLRFAVKDVEDLAITDDPPALVVCCEVLEHVNNPVRALENLAAIPCEHFIFSVPREPIWRILNLLRFSYVSALGNTPGHINHWTQSGFRRLIEKQFEIECLNAPLPWTIVRAKRRAARGNGVV